MSYVLYLIVFLLTAWTGYSMWHKTTSLTARIMTCILLVVIFTGVMV